MSELETFRNHCRAMAVAPEVVQRPKVTAYACNPYLTTDVDHEGCPWGWQGCACNCHDDKRPAPPTPAERIFWTRLADEIDDWLANGLQADVDPEAHTEPLWENA